LHEPVGTVSGMVGEGTIEDKRRVLFLSYAHEDRDLCGRVAKHVTRRAEHLGYRVWWDEALKPGHRWKQQIDLELDRAGAAIVLVSQDALDSDFVLPEEISYLQERDVPVAPLLARACDWDLVPEIKPQHFLHPPETGLVGMPGHAQEEILTIISRGLGDWLPECDSVSSDGTAQRDMGGERETHPGLEVAAKPGVTAPSVPDLPEGFQARDEELERFRTALLGEGPGAAGLTGEARYGLHGDGGTGKSVLAIALARDELVRRAFPDGVHWVEVGDKPNLAALQIELAEALGVDVGEDTNNSARRKRLSEALDQQRVLVVVDDVWNGDAVAAFDLAGPTSRVLYTTRNARLLATDGHPATPLFVDRLDDGQALSFLAHATGVDDAAELSAAARRVADATEGVILALRLAAGAHHHGMDWDELDRRFTESSRLYPGDDAGNLRAMRVALEALSLDDAERYRDLVVFPADTAVPASTIVRYWTHLGHPEPNELLGRLAEARLLELDHDPSGSRVRFHDDQLFYLQSNATGQSERHAELLAAHRPPDGWADLDTDEPYLWDHLVGHLDGAGQYQEATELATDLGWLVRRWSHGGSARALADLDHLGEMTAPGPAHERARRLHRRLRACAHLLPAADGEAMLAQTMASRLTGLDIDPAPLAMLQHQGRWLVPRTDLGGVSDAQLAILTGHTHSVNSVCAFTDPAGHPRLATTSHDKTLRIWDPTQPENPPLVLRLGGRPRCVAPVRRSSIVVGVDNWVAVLELEPIP